MLVNKIMPYCQQKCKWISYLSISPILIMPKIYGEAKARIQKNLYPRLSPPEMRLSSISLWI